MRVYSDTPALKKWRLWFGGLLIAEIGWFLLLRPHVKSFRSIFTLALIPVAVVGYIYVLAAISDYLDKRDWEYRFRQLIVVMLGASVGFFMFALMWVVGQQFEGEVS
jgi:hypothetical protein